MSVYAILHQTNHDYTSAEQYGEVEVLFPLGVNVTNINVITESARVWFREFDFEQDYFLPVGNPIVVASVAMCFAEEMVLTGVDEASILEWDKSSREYVTRKFTLSKECA